MDDNDQLQTELLLRKIEKLNKMTDKKFSEIYNGFNGSEIDKATQITTHNFTGEELKEYTEYVLKNHSVLHSIIRSFIKELDGMNEQGKKAYQHLISPQDRSLLAGRLGEREKIIHRLKSMLNS